MTVLAISSEVARGHVGNSAARFALHRLGHQVIALPTVILSNHPGHAHGAGTRIEPVVLRRMLDALDRNGWLGEVDAVLTGFLPTAEHVLVATEAIRRVKPDTLIVVDTVLGDDPKGLYVEAAAADAVRERLLPLADVITPNRFEASWLSGVYVTSDPQSVLMAAERLQVPHVVITSVPSPEPNTLDNVFVADGQVLRARVPRIANAPNGTGDLLAALIAGESLGMNHVAAFARAVAIVKHVLDKSAGCSELALVPAQDGWADIDPWPLDQ